MAGPASYWSTLPGYNCRLSFHAHQELISVRFPGKHIRPFLLVQQYTNVLFVTNQDSKHGLGGFCQRIMLPLPYLVIRRVTISCRHVTTIRKDLIAKGEAWTVDKGLHNKGSSLCDKRLVTGRSQALASLFVCYIVIFWVPCMWKYQESLLVYFTTRFAGTLHISDPCESITLTF